MQVTEGPKSGAGDTDEAVYNLIRRAIFSGLLRPGLKLQEPAIARLLNVSRERVRKALQRLTHEKWLDAVPNRGTFIPVPTVEELHAIYDARKILELGVTRQVATRSRMLAVDRLAAHVAREQEAARRDDRSLAFRLSAEFHFLLVELTGNAYLVDMHRGLMQRSSLHFSLFAPAALHECTSHNCAGPHEHARIMQAIVDGNAARAEKLMIRHLDELETLLALRRQKFDFLEIDEAFARLMQQDRERDAQLLAGA
ncbi:GntR family transcriptional regulator [Achromobacter aloeverae]|uniref:GntR family transcriptional regulator n=1 Tax=Achromobacter aloeverae TaxID=1750518 RepID=A0A4Q1HJQ3_9BURK|nr:GntR family transcriptional regulator [Achromobacter aloeverae]RXN90221.1 GntR family transcriptional regulator [Achromobacter aloeverae]